MARQDTAHSDLDAHIAAKDARIAELEAALERGTSAGAVSAELRAAAARATPGRLSGDGTPHREPGHPDVPRFALQVGKRPMIDGYVINAEDAAFMVATWNDAVDRIAAEGRARPAGGEEA